MKRCVSITCDFDLAIGKVRSIEIVPVLVAIGVTETGQKLVLSLQAGDKESATSWREFFKDLTARGLDGGKVTLGMMDGLTGLETVFREEFPKAKVQRCQVHVARNVLAKVPKKFKQDVANDLRSIFYAPSMPRHRRRRGNVLNSSGRDGKRACPLRWSAWSETAMPV